MAGRIDVGRVGRRWAVVIIPLGLVATESMHADYDFALAGDLGRAAADTALIVWPPPIMAQFCMPMLIVNMGGEMVYILEQRLHAQNVPMDKSKRGACCRGPVRRAHGRV